MSFVERALKKLQESGKAPPSIQTTAVPLVLTAEPVHQRSLPAASAVKTQAPAPASVLAIDKDSLRNQRLLPPQDLERRIASQYQQIKRPVIAAAVGRGDAQIPNGHLVMVASALPGEGKTFTSINLALSMALEKDVEVLLVDADVAKPQISRVFGAGKDRGLLDLLGDSSLEASSLVRPTDVPGLLFLPAGIQTDTATELLASARMQEVVKQLSRSDKRRIVLFDSPPLLLSNESRALVENIGHVVLVVHAESTPQSAVLSAIGLLGDSKPISLILNQSTAAPGEGYYGYGTYGDAPAGPPSTTKTP